MKKTIYIVTRGEYSDYRIEAVFSQRKQAIAFCAAHCTGGRIEEWYADDVNIETNKEPKALHEIQISKQCRKVVQHDIGGTFFELDDVESGEGVYIVNITLKMNDSKEKAQKIAFDMVAKYRAEKEGILT